MPATRATWYYSESPRTSNPALNGSGSSRSPTKTGGNRPSVRRSRPSNKVVTAACNCRRFHPNETLTEPPRISRTVARKPQVNQSLRNEDPPAVDSAMRRSSPRQLPQLARAKRTTEGRQPTLAPPPPWHSRDSQPVTRMHAIRCGLAAFSTACIMCKQRLRFRIVTRFVHETHSYAATAMNWPVAFAQRRPACLISASSRCKGGIPPQYFATTVTGSPIRTGFR